MTQTKKIKVEFAPGCFDQFDGTQEELDELVQQIQLMAESGELEENSRPVDVDNMSPEELEFIEKFMQDDDPRQLQ
jgi:hypothetical protein